MTNIPPYNARIQLRYDTSANWTTNNPILAEGEVGIQSDSSPVQVKFGDGITAWNSLSFWSNGTAYLAGAGILINNLTIAVDTTKVVDSTNASVNDIPIANGIGGYTWTTTSYKSTVGDGSSTLFTITHNLGSTDVLVSVIDLTSNEIVYPTVNIVDINDVTIKFSVAPTLNEMRVIVVKP